MIDLHTPDDAQAAAGEYVLGTLDSADVIAFEAALRDDRNLQAAVYAWQDRLLALSAQAPADEPSPVLWQRIAVEVEALSTASATPSTAPDSSPTLPWWRRVRPWQTIGGLALASSAVLAVLLAERSFAPPQGGHYLAVLQSPGDHVNGWIVDLQAGGRLRLVPVGAMSAVPAGRSLQFWTKPQGAAGPTSLGLVRAGETIDLPASSLPGVGEQQLFEITLEPADGSPVGRPTGPILFVGRTVAI